VLTGENCTIKVCRFIVSCARSLAYWKASPAKGEAQLLDLCCDWLAAQEPNEDTTRSALSLLILDLFPTARLLQALQHRGIPSKFASLSAVGGCLYTYTRQAIEDLVSRFMAAAPENLRDASSDHLEMEHMFTFELHAYLSPASNACNTLIIFLRFPDLRSCISSKTTWMECVVGSFWELTGLVVGSTNLQCIKRLCIRPIGLSSLCLLMSAAPSTNAISWEIQSA
jgi:hypothetical protein